MRESGYSIAHGGPDSGGVPTHDFSTNSNACGPCPDVLAVVQAADPTRYPDPSYSALRATLAAWHGVAPSRIVVAASASEFIARITALFARRTPRARVWLPPHGYGDYARAAAQWGLHATAAVADADLLWACDPTSPLGEPGPWLAAKPGATSVLDCAYDPLRLQGTPAWSAARRDCVWQLWSPNKALGMTGVRGAYAIAPVESAALTAQVMALAPSWVLGAHGVAMLGAWGQPAVQDWLAHSRETLRGWKAQQIERCQAMGWDVRPSVANFFCVRPSCADGTDMLGALRQAGIKLRDARSFGLPGLFRLGVLPPASQHALCEAWQRLLEYV